MSGSDRPNDIDFSRRTFMKGVGATAGAGLLGSGAAGTAAADSAIDERLLNWRNVEAKKVWDRGIRGRSDRTLGIIDSGIEARHPDLGPWNGVTAIVDDGKLRLIDPDASDRKTSEVGTIEEFRTGSAGLGTFANGDEVPTEQFVPGDLVDDAVEPTALDAELHWEPYEDNANDLELRLDVKVGEDDNGNSQWDEVATAATADMPEVLTDVAIDGTSTYRFVAEQYKNVQCDFQIDITLYEETGEYVDAGDPFAFRSEETDGPAPKTVGWYDGGARFGSWDVPRDPNSHGSHCGSIAAGSGRASTIDHGNTEVHEPHAVLLPGDFIEYEVDVHAHTSVFASAIGENVVLEVVHDDRVVHEGRLRLDSNIVDEPAVHDEGTETYTIRVRPMESRSAGVAAQQAQEGNPTVGRLQRIAVGSYVRPATEHTGARAGGDAQVVHPGVAPDTSLVGLQGFGGPTIDLGEHAEAFAEAFNMRAVNMSFGYPQGLPLGAFGGQLDDLPAALKQIANGGILPVAAAGNFMTPANGNGAPAGMDEPISVVATGPFDGITPYSAGGVGTVDEDENDVDRKPDVTAPGGDADDYAVLLATGVADANLPADVGYPVPSYHELVRAALTADPEADYADEDPPRDYTSKGGTSMASPFVCGVSGLVAQAMEERAPDSIALPEPAETEFGDVMRFKQVILATASETAFTAAPYHLGKSPSHVPTYDHGGRDPYEGFGRVNPDAAVDAVARNLLGDGPDDNPELGDDTATETYEESVGLYVPEDSRAVAGYVHAPGGDLDVSVEFTRYSGGNKGMAKEAPHLDLFVYDAESPAANGEPNIVASAQGRQGSASVSASVDRGSRDDPTERTFYVVAKIVNVPGVVNGFDVQAHFDLDVSFAPAEAFPPKEINLTASGSRSDDGTAFTGGQTNQITVTLDDFNGDAAESVRVFDTFPANWNFQDEWSEGEVDQDRSDDSRTVVDFGTVSRDAVGPDSSETFTYFVEAPSGASQTGSYTFGPASVEIEQEAETGPNETIGSHEAAFGGTDSNVVAGVDQNDPVGSTSEGASSGSDGATDGITDTVEDTL